MAAFLIRENVFAKNAFSVDAFLLRLHVEFLVYVLLFSFQLFVPDDNDISCYD